MEHPELLWQEGLSIRAAGHNFVGTRKLARANNGDMLTSAVAAVTKLTQIRNKTAILKQKHLFTYS